MHASRLFPVAFLLIFLGSVILVLGSASNSSSSSVGGVVFIGPIPIVFGTGPGTGTLLVVSVVIAVLMVAMFFASFLRARRQVVGANQ